MAKFISEKVSRNGGTAALPAVTRARSGQRRGGGFVRRLASVPGSLYGWVSGPALTNLERERATLAEARNSRGRGTLIV